MAGVEKHSAVYMRKALLFESLAVSDKQGKYGGNLAMLGECNVTQTKVAMKKTDRMHTVAINPNQPAPLSLIVQGEDKGHIFVAIPFAQLLLATLISHHYNQMIPMITQAECHSNHSQRTKKNSIEEGTAINMRKYWIFNSTIKSRFP